MSRYFSGNICIKINERKVFPEGGIVDRLLELCYYNESIAAPAGKEMPGSGFYFIYGGIICFIQW